MDNARLFFLFQRFRNGICSREEELEFIEYITENDNRQVRALLDELWHDTTHKLPAGEAERIVEDILTHNRSIPIYRKARNVAWARVAASVTLICMLGAFAYYQITFNKTNNLQRQGQQSLSEHQFIKLPDGSTAILNAGSTLDFPETFEDQSNREVYLTGEAFFDIKHDPAKAFIVRTGKLSTTVLGTAFNIRAYPDQNDITVTVTRGKVKVTDDRKVLGIINPDQQITFSKTTLQAQHQVVKSKEAIAWTERDIYFDDVSMADAVEQLEKRFDVTITFNNESTSGCRFTATFIKGEDLHQILDVICAFNKATYTKDALGNVEIFGNGCSI